MSSSQSTPEGAYAFDNAWSQARQRLRALEMIVDPWTIRHLTEIGVSQRWTCLEVGAGGGSIAEWLCQRVNEKGLVVATDIDTRFLDALKYPNLRVQRHDVTTDDLPNSGFDLVHARFLLGHLPERDAVFRRLVEAIRPGGWLLVEEPDHLTLGTTDPAEDPARAAAYRQFMGAAVSLLQARGVDLEYGRRLYGLCRKQGLVQVRAEGQLGIGSSNTPIGAFVTTTMRQVQPALIGAGLSEAEVEQGFTILSDPAFVLQTWIVVSACGQRPA